MIITMGYLLAILVNVVVNIWVVGLFLFRRLRTSSVPAWLLLVNFAFFTIQLILFIINR